MWWCPPWPCCTCSCSTAECLRPYDLWLWTVRFPKSCRKYFLRQIKERSAVQVCSFANVTTRIVFWLGKYSTENDFHVRVQSKITAIVRFIFSHVVLSFIFDTKRYSRAYITAKRKSKTTDSSACPVKTIRRSILDNHYTIISHIFAVIKWSTLCYRRLISIVLRFQKELHTSVSPRRRDCSRSRTF